MIRLAMVALALAAWLWAGPSAPGWLFALLIVANLALDVLPTLPARVGPAQRDAANGPGPLPAHAVPSQWALALDLVVAKSVYGLIFVLLVLVGRMASWLALFAIGRDVILVIGALWLWRGTGRLPRPTGHERWPAQLFLAILAVSAASGALAASKASIEPAVVLVFALVLTRLPGYWFRLCDLLDPGAYHPDLPGEPAPAENWRRALKAALARPSTRLTLAVVPLGLLALGLGGVWLAGLPIDRAGFPGTLLPSASSPSLGRMAALLGRVLPGTASDSGSAERMFTFWLLLPLTLAIPDLVGMHLREITLRRPPARPGLLWPGLFTAGVATALTAACLGVLALAGRQMIGPRFSDMLDPYTGALFMGNALLLSIVILSYPDRFANEPVLFRLQVAGGSLSTPAIGLLLGELMGLIWLRQAGIAVAVMLLFAGVMTQWSRIGRLLRAIDRPARHAPGHATMPQDRRPGTPPGRA